MYIKPLFILSLLVLAHRTSNGQNWNSFNPSPDWHVTALYVDTTSDLLYIGGEFIFVGNKQTNRIATWNGNNWDSLSTGFNEFNLSHGTHPTAIRRFNDKIYVSGNFQTAGGASAPWIAMWDGMTWDSLPFSVNDAPGNMKVWNNELYVYGVFDSAGNTVANGLAKWSGISWSEVNSLPNFNASTLGYNQIFCIENYQNELYIGGIFWGDSNRINIARWNGSNWLSVGNGVSGAFAGISSMTVYHNELYVAGLFFQADGNAGNSIMKWNGINWSDVGGGIGGLSFPQVHEMKIINNELYIVGIFNTAGNIPARNIAKWDGTKWCALGGFFDNRILTIEQYHDTIIIGGGFWSMTEIVA